MSEGILRPSEDALAALKSAINNIEKKFGAGSIMEMTSEAKPHPAISTGSLPLDIAVGIGGLPKGRIVEVFGPESSGKTTLVYHVIAEVQRQGGIAAFIDMEHAMDPVYAAACGVRVEDLIVSQPDHGQMGLDIADELIRSGVVQVVAFDSIAAAVPKAELEGEMGENAVGLQARLMGQAMRKLAGPASQNGCLVLFTNQIREKVGVMFGSPETQPGGRAVKFYASVRLDIRRIETLKEGTEVYGSRVRVKVVKNKVAAPYKQAEFDIIFGQGFDREGSLIDLGVELGLITKSGAFYSFPDGEKRQGKPKAREYLKDNPQIAEELEAKIRAEKLPHIYADSETQDEEIAAEVA
jgi:recombination protein RecA